MPTKYDLSGNNPSKKSCFDTIVSVDLTSNKLALKQCGCIELRQLAIHALQC